MDVKLSQHPFGQIVEILGATPDEVIQVLRELQAVPEVTLDTMSGAEEEEDRAFVGQEIPGRTRLQDFPKGVKVAQDEGEDLSWLHVSEDGRSYRWHDFDQEPHDPGTLDERNCTPFTTGRLTVKEVW